MSELRHAAATRWDIDLFLRRVGLSSPFPRGISHGDLDCEIEVNWHFLVIEGKRTGQALEDGQRYAMTARVNRGRTCLILYGDPDVGRLDFIQQWAAPPAPRPLIPAGWDDYCATCQAWCAWAAAQPQPITQVAAFRIPLQLPRTSAHG